MIYFSLKHDIFLIKLQNRIFYFDDLLQNRIFFLAILLQNRIF